MYTGASLTPGVGPAPIVLATASGVAGADPNLLRQCFSDDGAGHPVLDPAKVAGKIVVCERGGAAPANARVDKSLAVKNAGGVGVVIYNVAANIDQRRSAFAADGPCGPCRWSGDRGVRELSGRSRDSDAELRPSSRRPLRLRTSRHSRHAVPAGPASATS